MSEVKKMEHIFIMNDIKKLHEFETHIHTIMESYDYKIIYAHSRQEIIDRIKKLKNPSRIYAVGGDGTMNIFIQAMVHTDHELVVIPLGTGNDFCRVLTNKKNPVQLLEQSLTCSCQKVDTIFMSDLYYINSACFGLDSIIATHVHDTPHVPLIPESKSYIVSILQHVFQYAYDEVEVKSGGQLLYRGPVTLCTVNNGQYYGGGFQITPQAKINDGYMDICIVEKIPKVKIPYVLTFLLRHQLHKRKEVHYYQVKDAHVIAKNSCNMDGEEVIKKEYDFQIIPKSLNLVVYKKL